MLYFQLFWYCCHNLVTLHMFMSALLSVSPFPFSSISPFPFLYFFSSTPFPFFFSSTPLPFPPLRYFLSEKTICCDCPASPGTHCVSKQRWTKTYFVFRGLVFSLPHWQLSKQWWCNARLEEGETGEEKGGSSIREPFTSPSTLQCWLYIAQNNLHYHHWQLYCTTTGSGHSASGGSHPKPHYQSDPLSISGPSERVVFFFWHFWIFGSFQYPT